MIKLKLLRTREGEPGHGGTGLRALIVAADAARDRRDWPAAAALYRQVFEADPTRYDLAIQLGHMLKESADYEAADDAYAAALAGRPDDDDLHLQIGHLRKLQRDLPGALAAYRAAMAIAPGNLAARAEHDRVAALLAAAPASPPSPSPVPPIAAPSSPAPSASIPSAPIPSAPIPSAPAPPPLAAAAPTAGPDRQPEPSLDAATLRTKGDLARDARHWDAAARHYGAYLDLVPDDAPIRVQLGHMLKESGNLAGGEAAYRAALRLMPQDADLHLQLGHVLKLRGRRLEALEAYRESFRLRPVRSTAVELRGLDPEVDIDLAAPPHAGTRTTYVEISDLLIVLARSATVSGIQRVQLGLLSHLLGGEAGRDRRLEVAAWQDGRLWRLPAATLRRIVAEAEAPGEADLAERRRLLAALGENAVLAMPGQGDTLVETGATWLHDDLTAQHERLKAAGVRLGACLYDFIPLTHPEYCHSWLTERFSNTIADALLHLDFALPISDFTRDEMQRLLRQGGYPALPARTVALAHEQVQPAGEEWTPAIAELQGTEYVLCVGTMHAHKNHALMLQAWQILLRRGMEPPTLVFAGSRGHGVDELFRQLEATDHLDGRVKVFEGLSDRELATLYRGCLFTAFPSIVEGWGLPVGESLAYGKVCIAANTSAIPEVGGALPVYVDPFSGREMADAVAALLEDRGGLARREAAIRQEFRPRSWAAYGAAFLRAVDELAAAERRQAVVLEPGRIVRPRQHANAWRHGTALPRHDALVRRVLGRLVLGRGWHPPETWGSWTSRREAEIGFATPLAPGSAVRVLLQLVTLPWPRRNRVTVRAGCGASRSMALPATGRTEFVLWLDCTVGEAGRVALTLSIEGAMMVAEDPRELGVGLARLLYLPRDEGAERLEAARLVRPAPPLDRAGNPAVPRDRAAFELLLRQGFMLGEGWGPLERDGTWMDAPRAGIAFGAAAAPGSLVRVALRLAFAPRARGLVVTARSACGGTGSLAAGEGDLLWIDCRVGAGRRIALTLETAGAARGAFGALVRLVALAYGAQEDAAERLRLAEALLFPRPERPAAAEERINITVAGHLKGSYSLAAVNRRLALSLDAALPGQVRVEQVEGQPVQDLTHMPPAERARLRELARVPEFEEGAEIVIAQHWPVWVPPPGRDLPLAYVFWEESRLPRQMVETLNHGFRGVLASSRSVAKALVDSGVSLPVRVIGYAPDLGAFQAAGQRRPALREKPIAAAAPFTFLHVSSCFPRKGVDVLLAAFARAFRRGDPVRLLVKGFHNPHNTVAADLAAMQAADPQMPAVTVLDRDLLTEGMAKLYESADAVVLPTRGEGFNIPAAEALAAGLPLIVTGFGAQTDFASPDAARLIDYRFAQSRSHLATPGSVWAEPDAESLARLLRETFEQARAAEAGDAAARAGAAARRARGQAIAARVGDPAAWAARVTGAARALLAAPPAAMPSVAWISTWNVRCGIAEYSRMLLDRFGGAADRVAVLCDERTAPGEPNSPHGWPVVRAWRVLDPRSIEGLLQAIERTDAALVVIQHHPGLINWPELATILTDRRLAGRQVTVTLHNVRDLLASDPLRLPGIAAALATASRVLVHTVRDVNHLKGIGLIDNVTLFPQGADRQELVARPARPLPADSAPLIGAYGFLLPHKGFATLIQAFARLRGTWPQARLRMVTAEYPIQDSAEEMARCRHLAAQHGVAEAVEWHTGYLPNAQSLALLHECDLTVLPYQETPESSSAAVRNAIASRTPVAVTPISIFDDVDDAVLRLPGIGVEEVAGGIAALLRDAAARGAVQERAGKWLEEHDWALLGRRLRQIGQGLAASASDGAGMPAG
ncbi:glycosyltransferase [Roseomonas sp. NAR14]|uniref:Glycosyltransferase n=1 Tax=Roseomonas acroporae TaxID=2937791 RepID=A0A9X2BSF4_9PROT|nr:glycosyltransferase [Roseomonas acroporae]MCK8783508.1 glycosyltransferase [Roseomonas acroporae]